MSLDIDYRYRTIHPVEPYHFVYHACMQGLTIRDSYNFNNVHELRLHAVYQVDNPLS